MERIQEVQKIGTLRETFVFINITIPLLLLSLMLFGCASTYPSVKPDLKKVDIDHARWEIPESLLLDVRIQVFDPGKLPSNLNASRGLSEEIRKAESQYMAVQLRKAMQPTGYWGAVRVVPAVHPGYELLVTGRILKSNGEELKLRITAIDAMGERWLDKTFKGAVSAEMYKEVSQDEPEIFLNVYNQIANELAAYRKVMTSDQVQEIRHVAEMQFTEDLAPSAFTGYLREDTKRGLFEGKKSEIRIDRLPSDDDEMFKRVKRVREHDYALVDTLDDHYEELHREIQQSYTDWRNTRVQEMNMIREIDDKKNKQQWKAAGLIAAGAAVGAAAANANNQGYNSYNTTASSVVGAVAGAAVALYLDADRIGMEAEINKAALEELGTSFATEVEPTVLSVEGETITLTGTAEAKYQQWREVLARLYKIETEA